MAGDLYPAHPGHNDSPTELAAMCRWLVTELGPDVPLHFSTFHPDHKMLDVPSTPAATLVRARDIAHGQGLRFVYTDSVGCDGGRTTACPACRTPLIDRDGYEVSRNLLTPRASCPACGAVVAGRFSPTIDPQQRSSTPIAITIRRAPNAQPDTGLRKGHTPCG